MYPLVSIIVPVYNAETDIGDCIQSLTKQSFTRYEIIVINDGSTDRTREICNQVAAENEKISVIHQQNAGVSVARNVGLKAARGKWIIFVDADDKMAPEAIEKALTFAEEQNADTVCWNCYHECDDIISKYPPIIPDGGIYQGDEMQKLLTEALYNTHTEHFYPGMMFRAVWGKLLSAEVIRNNAISFPIGLPLGEDAAFLAEYFNYCNKVLLVNRYWNYYKISSASAVGKYKSNLKKIQMKELEIIKTRIHVDKVDMDTILLNQYLQFDYKYVRNLYKRNKDFFAIYRDLIKYIKEREYKFKRFSEYDKSKINKKSIPVAWSMVNHLSYVEAFFLHASGVETSNQKVKDRNVEMKKIGIVTILDNNLGNRLQNYALQEVICKLGYKVETIQKGNKNGPMSRYIKYIIKKKLNKKDWKFREFDRKIHWSRYSLLSSSDKSKIAQTYDILVAGSDQVWNPYFGGTNDLFLTFAPKEKRISYAASFGVSELPSSVLNIYENYMRNFKIISVREKQAMHIVEQFKGCHAEVVLDPTLLLSKNEWKRIAIAPKTKEKYVLKYLLGEDQTICNQMINDLLGNVTIVDVKSMLSGKEDRIGPAEFLGLVDNAELICTDSFHASVFSTIFEKPFVIFERTDKEKNMSSRMDSLCETLALQDHRYSSVNFDVSKVMQPDYSKTMVLVEEEKSNSLSYLERAIKN